VVGKIPAATLLQGRGTKAGLLLGLFDIKGSAQDKRLQAALPPAPRIVHAMTGDIQRDAMRTGECADVIAENIACRAILRGAHVLARVLA
jgi:hypothetical protein